MGVYIQRQFSGILVTGTNTDPSTYSIAGRVMDFRDAVPSSVLKIDDGLYANHEYTVGTLGSLALRLPEGYSSANRLFFRIRSDYTLRVVSVLPVLGTSTALWRPGLATDQLGLMTFCGRVTSITVTNPTAVRNPIIPLYVF